MWQYANKVWGGYTAEIQYAPWRAVMVAITPNPRVSGEAYRPIGWAQKHPQTFIEDPDGNLWYFDAVMRLEHLESQRVTQHPVQTGANITDHSYAQPAQLTLDIGMSDVDPSVEDAGFTKSNIFLKYLILTDEKFYSLKPD